MLILEVLEDMLESNYSQHKIHIHNLKWEKLLPLLLLLTLPAAITWPLHPVTHAQQQQSNRMLITAGRWSDHKYDLIYTLAFSSVKNPNGPLIVYRASSTNLNVNIPVIVVQRDIAGSISMTRTPIFYPSPKGDHLALLTPTSAGATANLSGASLDILTTDGQSRRSLVPHNVAQADQPVWSPDGSALYYHTGTLIQETQPLSRKTGDESHKSPLVIRGTEEIHRVDLKRNNRVLWRYPFDGSTRQLVGVDRENNVIMSVAASHEPVQLVSLRSSASSSQLPQHLMTLPADILPGNILGLSKDGMSVDCMRVLSWHPMRTIQMRFSLHGQFRNNVYPPFATTPYGTGLSPLTRSADGKVLVMSYVNAIRADLTARGIPNVPQQETLLLKDQQTGASQRLTLPAGGQLVQTFWTSHKTLQSVHAVPQNVMQQAFALPATSDGSMRNASIYQQDQWMIEAHANLLADGPSLPGMCYGNCADGLNDPPHVSAAIMHGVAYTESNWHQFNAPDYNVSGEAIGSPVKSWDGGWGEYQQTWGMPPQCQQAQNCRSDYLKVENDQAYNVGTGAQALINAWNGSAGVISTTDFNDPFKANHWFFAVWAYNGSYGNNPADIPSTSYAHWYPGAPFRSIYEEYVWYFAAHPQSSTSRYLPSLDTALLPPQQDFQGTSDNFVSCVTCTIPDWTPGTFDRSWVGQGAPTGKITGEFQTFYNQAGGEVIVGLPVDTGRGAAVSRLGNGILQTMDGGSFKSGALMMANGSSNIYWVFGSVWTRYLQDKGATGCHGYPTSSLKQDTDPGLSSDTYYQQTFQHGSIIWDATTGKVAVDAC